MEVHIAKLMVRMAKFEFFMIRSDRSLAQINGNGKVEGIQYSVLKDMLVEKFDFDNFDFDKAGFRIFKDEPPQYLVIQDDKLKWDGDDINVNDWEKILTKSYAQLRNNLAHGSKSLRAAQFTSHRTPIYLAAGHAMIDFIALEVFKAPDWEQRLDYT